MRCFEVRECRFDCDEILKEQALATSNSPSALGWGTPRLAGTAITRCLDQAVQLPEYGLESIKRILQPRKFVDLVRRQQV